jgi:hypothetical protein
MSSQSMNPYSESNMGGYNPYSSGGIINPYSSGSMYNPYNN